MRRSNPMPALLPVLVLPVALLACDAQNDGRYQGEAMATLTGTIVNKLETAPPHAELAVVWRYARMVEAGDKPGIAVVSVTEKAEVTPSFPANFQFKIHLPPPPEALDDNHGTPTAVGELAVLKAGTIQAGPLDPDKYTGNLLARGDETILYFKTAPSPFVSLISGGAKTAGFHLFRNKTHATVEDVQQYRQRCLAVATSPPETKLCEVVDSETQRQSCLIGAKTPEDRTRCDQLVSLLPESVPGGIAHPITIVLKDQKTQ